MKTLMKTAMMAPVAASLTLAVMMAVSAPASAQAQLTNGPEGMQPNTLSNRPHTAKRMRPLTVRRAVVAPVAAAAAAPAAAAGFVTGTASTVVGLPFQALGGIFPAGGARTGGVTPVRYAGAGEKAAEVDEGWAMAVPVYHSGPIFVVANGDPTISPLSLIGQPLGAIGTFAQTPFKVIGATGL